MKLSTIAAAALLLAGCSDLIVGSTTAPAGQAKTLAEAEQSATIAEQGLDVIVKSGKLSAATLKELQVLVPAVHTTLKDAEAANKAGDNAGLAAAIGAFNQAVTALTNYESANK
jgi:hypothetical protein